jgi:teichuronic acid exporter
MAIEKSITGTIIIAAPTSLGFSAISHEFISLLFGEKWLGAIPILSILCFGGVAYAIKETAANALVIYNKIKLSTYISWLSAFIILITIYPTYLNFETEGVAWLLVATNILTAITSIFLLCRLKLINANEIIKGIARPTLSAVIMLISINWLVDHISINSHSTAAAIAVKIMLGSIIYTFTITLLWFASGKPNSSEKVLLTIFLNKFFK